MYNEFMQLENQEITSCWIREEHTQSLVDESDERIDGYVNGKSVEDIKANYEAVLFDVGEIELGHIEPPYSGVSCVPGQSHDEAFYSNVGEIGSGLIEPLYSDVSWCVSDVGEIESGLIEPLYSNESWCVDRVPSQSHHEGLLFDVGEIESDRVGPPYSDESCVNRVPVQSSFGAGRGRGSGVKRKKGTPWTEDEQRLFLIRLKKYGKGDWRMISRDVVKSKTPTQVASHAQKYFIRLESGKKKRKRSSIFDITKATDITMPAPTNLTAQAGFQDFGS